MARGPNGQIKKKHGKRRRPAIGPQLVVPEPSAVQAPPLYGWSIVQCMATDQWEERGIASLYVLQQDPRLREDHTFTAFLIDLWGVGLKDAFQRFHTSRRRVERELERLRQERMLETDPPAYIPCSTADMRRLVSGGIEWARQHGFRTPPHIIRIAESVLGPAAKDEPPDLSEFGRNGKPFLIGDPQTLAPFLVNVNDHPSS